LVEKVRTAPDLEIPFGIPEFVMRSEFCDGNVLLVTWEYDGSKDIEIPFHAHAGIYERTTMVTSGLVRYTNERGFTKDLTKSGDSFYSPLGDVHDVLFLKDGGPARGWTTFQPPDMDAVPSDSVGNCMMRPYGRCGGDPRTCMFSRVKALARQR